jgi:hypothetical protein
MQSNQASSRDASQKAREPGTRRGETVVRMLSVFHLLTTSAPTHVREWSATSAQRPNSQHQEITITAQVLSPALLVMLLLASAGLAQQRIATIHLKNGTVIAGTILQESPGKSVTIKPTNDVEQTYLVAPTEKAAIEVDTIGPRDLRKDQYPELGLTLGTPGGANLVAGYWFGDVGVRLMGMTFASYNGIQMNIGVKLSDNTNRSHALALVFGTSMFKETTYSFLAPDAVIKRYWTYGGLAYSLNWHGFYLEGGLTVGNGLFPFHFEWNGKLPERSTNPQAVFQIGYVYRFFKD